MTEFSAEVDVLLVGAGPIGLEMAVALKRANLNYSHVEAKQIGHTISWFAPQTRFFSSNERIAIAGVPLVTVDQAKASREEYLAYLRMVVTLFDLDVRAYEPVVAIRRVSDIFEVTTKPRGGDDRITRARHVIMSTGGTDRPRRIGIPGETLPHVSNYFQDPHTYFRQRLLIVGGKNSAVEAALRCHHAGASVALSYRRDKLPEQSIKYWLMPEIRGLLESNRIDGHFNTTPIEITPTHVRLRRDNGEAFDVAAESVLMLIGYEQDNALFKLAGLALEGDCGAPLLDQHTMESSVNNVYVIGTAVAGTQDKYRVFIENCHVHIDRVMAALMHHAAPPEPEHIETPES